jgi:hypothetical protein
MGSVIDTLAVAFTADVGPLAARLSEIDGMLRGVGTFSQTADASLRSMAGALDFSMGSLKAGAYAAGAAVGTRFAEGLRGRRGAVDAAVKYLTASALAALNRLLGSGTPTTGGMGTGATATVAASRFDEKTLAGGTGALSGENAVNNITIPISVDGIKLGEACVKGLSRVSKLTGRGIIEL